MLISIDNQLNREPAQTIQQVFSFRLQVKLFPNNCQLFSRLFNKRWLAWLIHHPKLKLIFASVP
jgi:hypothetical protein